jgi:hypothetical protein
MAIHSGTFHGGGTDQYVSAVAETVRCSNPHNSHEETLCGLPQSCGASDQKAFGGT